MARVYGHEIGKAVCLALGVDPDTCVEIDLRARVGELATVTVETYAEPKDMEPLATELRKYHLVPIEDEDAEPVQPLAERVDYGR